MKTIKSFASLQFFSIGFSMIFLIVNIYVFAYSFFLSKNLTSSLVNKLLVIANDKLALFSASCITKLISLSLLAIFISYEALESTDNNYRAFRPCVTVSVVVLGLLSFFFRELLLVFYPVVHLDALSYAVSSLSGYLLLFYSFFRLSRTKNIFLEDIYNDKAEEFKQQKTKVENPHSINLRMSFNYRGKRKGWLNIINPFRGTIVLGLPGSGKSFTVVNSVISQHIAKNFAMCIYDFKYPQLTSWAYNEFLISTNSSRFYIINFDDLQRSYRCNPIESTLLSDIIDAQEAATTLLLNLNRSWINQHNSFFTSSAINLLTAIIWYLKKYDDGKYCTLPHALELLNSEYNSLFRLLESDSDTANYIRPFIDAKQNGAYEQLEGQIATCRIPLLKLQSKLTYWVMSGNDFTLDINNPRAPKILCLGNSHQRQEGYSAILALYASRMFKLINKPQQAPCSLVIDELPTLYLRGLDNLAATCRSNKIAITLGLQNRNQLERDYGRQEASVLMSTFGNIIAGQTTSAHAQELSMLFGKVKQQRISITKGSRSKSENTSSFMDNLIPASKIAALRTGHFVGMVADDSTQANKVSRFNAQLHPNPTKAKGNRELPIITDLSTQMLDDNYNNIKQEVKTLINEQIKNLDQRVKDSEGYNKGDSQLREVNYRERQGIGM